MHKYFIDICDQQLRLKINASITEALKESDRNVLKKLLHMEITQINIGSKAPVITGIRFVKNLHWVEDNEKKINKKKKISTQETHPKLNMFDTLTAKFGTQAAFLSSDDMGKAFAFGKNIGKRWQKTFGLGESNTSSTGSTIDHTNNNNDKKNSIVDSHKQMFQRQNSKDDMTLNLSTKSLTSERSLTGHEEEEEEEYLEEELEEEVEEEEEKIDNDDHDEDIENTLDESKTQHSSIDKSPAPPEDEKLIDTNMITTRKRENTVLVTSMGDMKDMN
ncbi:HrpA family SFII helicase [Reticulomyxa filosa]|uniref:HrpA family SFII helicase n=1 Tax=Reticulomyxa filosa TaxID=46433 RepID=X6LVN2_RETFI|nr:HrpA family SFII helicase [Reticulomyxa filosa]|eukprot:ETO05212.1 HrpA family SFII helicase [Reticulomyxa filosa]